MGVSSKTKHNEWLRSVRNGAALLDNQYRADHNQLVMETMHKVRYEMIWSVCFMKNRLRR